MQTTVTEYDINSRLFIPMNKSDQILIANWYAVQVHLYRFLRIHLVELSQ